MEVEGLAGHEVILPCRVPHQSSHATRHDTKHDMDHVARHSKYHDTRYEAREEMRHGTHNGAQYDRFEDIRPVKLYELKKSTEHEKFQESQTDEAVLVLWYRQADSKPLFRWVSL